MRKIWKIDVEMKIEYPGLLGDNEEYIEKQIKNRIRNIFSYPEWIKKINVEVKEENIEMDKCQDKEGDVDENK